MIRNLILHLAAHIGAALEVHEEPFTPATPAQIEQARSDMRQGAITDGIDYRMDHLDGAVILDDLAAWDREFRVT